MIFASLIQLAVAVDEYHMKMQMMGFTHEEGFIVLERWTYEHPTRQPEACMQDILRAAARCYCFWPHPRASVDYALYGAIE